MKDDNRREPTQDAPAASGREPAMVAPGPASGPHSPPDGSDSESMATTSPFSPAHHPAGSSEPLPGRLQDRYVFRSRLGSGGFGAVYEAWDEVLQRSVAIKLARRDRLNGASGCQQFLDEARAAAKLKHSYIVTVFDTGTDPEGNPFVVFEMIAGESLAARMKRQPLSRPEALTVMIAVAEAVQVAHKLGMVHRDLKPANVMLDKTGQPHLADFGLAVDEHSQREQAGIVAGSPQYMSPEQVRGETQYLDGRSDIWSLGVILYELLCHRRPFSGRTRDELKDEILHREPRPLRQIDDSLSAELEAACLRCLNKEVTARYSTAADLAADLRRLLSSATDRGAGKWLGKRRVWGAVAAVLAIVAMGVAIDQMVSDSDKEQPPASAGSPGQAERQPAGPSQAAKSDDTAAAEAVAPEVIVPKAPTPGKWFPLLTRKPTLLLWPQDGRNSRFEPDPTYQELWLTCDEVGLVALGNATGDFDLQLNLHQSPWAGDIGVFWGMHDDMQDGVPVWHYQSIELTSPRQRTGERAFLNRVVTTRQMTGTKIALNRQTLAVVRLPVLRKAAANLRLTVSDGRLSSVQWNDQALSELVADPLDQTVGTRHHTGDFGIVIERSSVVIRRAEYLIPLGESGGPNP